MNSPAREPHEEASNKTDPANAEKQGVKASRYPVKSVIGDYLRAAAGLTVTLGLLLAGSLHWILAGIFALLAGLFLVFALRSLQRHHLEVAFDGKRITTQIKPAGSKRPHGYFMQTLAWRDLSGMKLRYFGTRRHHRDDKGSGFMQLTLTGKSGSAGRARKTTMRFESSLDGFSAIAAQAAQSARALNLPIDPATAGNLLTLGIDFDAKTIDETPI
jgi:hypothetical protein